jgi:hypothetical protein
MALSLTNSYSMGFRSGLYAGGKRGIVPRASMHSSRPTTLKTLALSMSTMSSVWRGDEDKGPLAPRITKRGLAVIRVDEGGALPEAEETPQDRARDRSRTRPAFSAGGCCSSPEDQGRGSATVGQATSGASKQARVIEMLHRREGPIIATIMKPAR